MNHYQAQITLFNEQSHIKVFIKLWTFEGKLSVYPQTWSVNRKHREQRTSKMWSASKGVCLINPVHLQREPETILITLVHCVLAVHSRLADKAHSQAAQDIPNTEQIKTI